MNKIIYSLKETYILYKTLFIGLAYDKEDYKSFYEDFNVFGIILLRVLFAMTAILAIPLFPLFFLIGLGFKEII